MISIDDLKAPHNRGALGLAILRIATGVMFLFPAWGKIMREGGFAGGMTGFLNGQQNMFEWYRGIVDAVVIPNAEIFAFLVAYGELALALALILGVSVRAASIGGLVIVLNFWFAKGAVFWQASNHDSLYILIFLMFIMNHQALRFLSLHDWVKAKFARLPD